MNPYDLKSLHTKVLMNYRKMCYKFNGNYDPTGNNGTTIKLKDILAELSTREHVPSKVEAKAIRQEKARNRK